MSKLIRPEHFARLRDIRAHEPAAVATALSARRRPPDLAADGRLLIVAADHPARGALGAGPVAMAMANRYELLQRLVEALSRPGVDGVLGTADIIEDLALLGALDGKVVVGSMNRGGLRGSVFEIDDRFTGYDIAGATASGLDFTKLLFRIDLQDAASVRTQERAANAVTQAAAARMPIMIEPFMSHRVDGRVVNDLSPSAVIHAVAISAGLGASSAYTWLKLPVIDEMEQVMAATTLPTLLLGGDLEVDQNETFERWAGALRLPGVRGLVVGRALLYPADGDVARAVDLAADMVHTTTISTGKG